MNGCSFSLQFRMARLTIANMSFEGIGDIDEQIGQLEKELGALYAKRVAALEAEIKRSRGLIAGFTASTAPVQAPAPEAAPHRALVTKRAKKKVAKTKRAHAQLPSPANEAPAPTKAIEETKAAAARAKPQPVQTEIFPELPAAAPAPAKKKVARKAKQPKQPKKRTRTPTAVVEQSILDALKEASLFGLSQIEVSQKTGLGYQTVLQKLKKLPGIEKKGSGKEGRFFLKG